MLAVHLSTPQRINLLFNAYHMMYKLGLIIYPGQNFIKQGFLGRGSNVGSTFKYSTKNQSAFQCVSH